MSGDSIKRSMSDQAVASKTQKTWPEWFAVLDAFGVGRSHRDRARFLQAEHALTPWWSQTVTVEYERARGLRDVNQKCTGDYEVSVSRTISAPASKAFEAWSTELGMDSWFSTGTTMDFRVGGRYQNADRDGGEFRAIVPNSRIRFTWEQKQHRPGSVVEVRFYENGPSKCQVVLQHSGLANKAEVEDLREGWSWAMDSLRSYLETGSPIRFESWKAANTGRSSRAQSQTVSR
jgi:uncharacterized protein YndB with AHSA1/START domain